jgi:hypothetical protein
MDARRLWVGLAVVSLVVAVVAVGGCAAEERTPEEVAQASSALTWTELQKLPGNSTNELFGSAAAMDDTTAVIGAYNMSTPNAGQGAGYVYVRSGSTWSLQQKLTASDASAGQRLGQSAALSGDTVVLGAPYSAIGGNTQQGAAYVFVRSGSTWTQQAKLTAPDGATNDLFGLSVDIDGDNLIVGSPSADLPMPTPTTANAGAAYVYVRSGSTWSLQQKLVATLSGGPQTDDSAGHGVALVGNTAAVGAPNRVATHQGAVMLFVRSGTTWTETSEVQAKNKVDGGQYGWSVAMDGSWLVATSFGQTFATVYLLTGGYGIYKGMLTTGTFTESVSVAGNWAWIGSPYVSTNTGEVRGFSWDSVNWTAQQTLTASDAATGAAFGRSVAATSNGLFVGAYAGDGKAYFFSLVGGSCSSPSQCSSGNCVDGVCCNTACSGPCDICTALGANPDGICSFLPEGSTPTGCTAPRACSGASAACASSCGGDADCAAGYYCNAAHSCVAQKTTGNACNPTAGNDCTADGCRVCTSGNCVDGFCCDTGCTQPCDVCAASMGATANGTCSTAKLGLNTATCVAPYACNGAGASCPTSCSSDNDCALTAYCGNDSLCHASKGPASGCNAAGGADCKVAGCRVCTSGNCVDGYCCNNACSGQCGRCDAAGTQGTCTPLADGATPEAPGCNGLLCDGSVTGCPSTCVGDGDCAATHYCSSGQCLLKACASDANCAATHYCANSGECTLRKGPANACNPSAGGDCKVANCRVCQSDNCVDGYCCDTACTGLCAACNLPTKQGTCSPLADGATPDSPGCSGYLCNGSSLGCATTCSGNQDCATTHYCSGITCLPSGCGSDSDCASDRYCDKSGVCQLRKDPGLACNAASGADCMVGGCRVCKSNNCVDGYCCTTACTEACGSCGLPTKEGTCSPLADNATPDAPGCSGYLCNGASTTCPSSCVTGADCDTAHYCAGGQCLALACTSDTDCAATHYCANDGNCHSRKPQGAACNTAIGADCKVGGCRVCQTDNCVDGYCCNTACTDSCGQCNATGKEGTCSPLADGVTPDAPGCSGYLCNGSQVTCATTCATNADCDTAHYCSNSQCLVKACNSDTGCAAGYYCDASGSCAPQKVQGSTCNPAAGADCKVASCKMCATNNCVDGYCCNTACNQECATCAAATKEGTCSPDADGATPSAPGCSGTLCNGTITTCPSGCAGDADCAATHFCSNNVCVLKKGPGESCTSASQCGNSAFPYCVDGVCCDTLCDGTCMACAAANKQSGTNGGTCGAAKTGTNPGSKCIKASDPCGDQDSCSGAPGVCNKAAYGAACGPTSCSNGNVSGKICDGTGTCIDQSNAQCSPYVCKSGACSSPCSGDGDCVGGYYCSSGTCVAQSQNGKGCSAANQCTSGFCVDGVCCDAPCNGQCQACDVVVGQCSVVTGDPHGSRPACTGTGTCKGTCDGANPTSCTFPGSSTSCAAAGCTGDVSQPAGTCDSAGSCAIPATKNCLPYSCQSSSGDCLTSCAGDTDCAQGATCDTSTGKCAIANATCEDSYTVKLPNGQTQSCEPYKCVGGACQQQCSTSNDCATGYDCQGSSCVAVDAGTGGSAGAGAGGTSGSGATGGVDAGGGPSGGAAGSPATGGKSSSGSNDSGGCGCRTAGRTPGDAPLLLLLAALGVVSRRRRERRRRGGAR